ncbi:MAG: hypothetical protein KF696_00570 [Planctomycetes bacterium]|nr:hypothetical protein [Planctomycetota bacterium]MCW8134567.1 hypothetical protein [Planctomycetota bacterium]
MALSPTAVKYIAIAIVVLVACLLIVSIVWDALKLAIGLLIGVGLIYLGIRFLFGKGLPPAMKKVADKALKTGKEVMAEDAKDDKNEETR